MAIGSILLLGGLLMVVKGIGRIQSNWYAGFGMALVLVGTIVAWQAYRLPSFHAREACRSHLRMIGAALVAYQDDHGVLPRNLQVLIEVGILLPDNLRSRLSSQESTGHCDYAYIVDPLPPDRRHWVRAFELTDVHNDGTRCILFFSGEARTVGDSEFHRIMTTFVSEFRKTHSNENGLICVLPRHDSEIEKIEGPSFVIED